MAACCLEIHGARTSGSRNGDAAFERRFMHDCYATTAVSLSPKALMTFITVPRLGLPSFESEL